MNNFAGEIFPGYTFQIALIGIVVLLAAAVVVSALTNRNTPSEIDRIKQSEAGNKEKEVK
jgi:hypothetical protein